MIMGREGAGCMAHGLCGGGCSGGLPCTDLGKSRVGAVGAGVIIAVLPRRCPED